MRGTHRKAVERTIKAGEGRLTDVNAAVVELCRTLADQMDGSGSEGPTTRTVAAYLSALKDLTRAIGDQPATPSGSLASMRSLRERSAPLTKSRPRRSAG